LTSGPRTGRATAAVRALALVLLAGCASAPPPAGPPDPDAPFAFRSPADFPLEGTVVPADSSRIARGLAELKSGRLADARRIFQAGAAGPSSLRFRLGVAYVDLASSRWELARSELEAILVLAPGWFPAVEARADLDAAEGRLREAFDAYRELASSDPSDPSDPRISRRLDAVRSSLLASLGKDAERNLADGNLAAARLAALAAVDVDPSVPDGYGLVSKVAEADGDLENAWTAAARAHALDPSDAALTRAAAALAMKTERYADAVALYGALAKSDRASVEQLEEASFQFQVQNLPDAARKAALSTRLTRAQLAALLWWLVPEVREARVPAGSDVAVDAVDRPDSQSVVRAIALGFFAVSRDTHRVGVDQPVTRTELAACLKRVALLASAGAPIGGCLGEERPSPASLAECGILLAPSARTITGREAVRALEEAGRAAREGTPR
jgi:tetratricopeptide (TPR) repeat protein